MVLCWLEHLLDFQLAIWHLIILLKLHVAEHAEHFID
jgi:hypothetical protein